jgi:hypothetical protein
MTSARCLPQTAFTIDVLYLGGENERMDFPPRWLTILVVLATLATLAFAAIAAQWILVAVVLVFLLIEVFMSGPVDVRGDLRSGLFRITGYLGKQTAPLPSYSPKETNSPTPDGRQEIDQVAGKKPPA